MSELPKKRRKLTKVEEGQIIKMTEPMFDYFKISNEQLQRFAEVAKEAADFYNKAAENLFGPDKSMFKLQEKIANQTAEIAKVFANFKRINFIISIPRIDSYIFQKSSAIPIYTQTNRPYIPIKELPSGRRKQKLPLSTIEIRENGFLFEGKCIKGLTLKSQVGKLLELIITKGLQGPISYQLIGQTTDKDPTQYYEWGVVMRDLKYILMENMKLKLDIERYPGLKEYHVKGLTKYLRRPRSLKKLKNKRLTN